MKLQSRPPTLLPNNPVFGLQTFDFNDLTPPWRWSK